MNVNILLFEDFTALDVFGPVEVLGSIEEYTLRYLGLDGGIIMNHQNIKIQAEKVEEKDYGGIWLIPGGWGTRRLVKDAAFLSLLKKIAESSVFCLSVCTGAALLAKCGVLDGRKATSNKQAFDWVMSLSDRVLWDREARWIKDGKFYTSAGVSAGIDMSLGFVSDQFGEEKARAISARMEYRWRGSF